MATAIEQDFLPPSPRVREDVPRRRAWDETRPLSADARPPRMQADRCLPGTSIRLGPRLGGGGSGVIHRAIDRVTGRTLAVKLLREDRPDHADGLRQEAELLQHIDSPWVVRLHRSGTLPDGRPWLAMEMLEGQPLSRWLARRRRVELPRVIRWLRQACYGLAALHDAGWAHRDVKPSNFVLVDDPGAERLVLVDLGIAARFGVRPQALSGTPEYIAPEQAQAKPVDLRSDVYALGCCAYELLAGRPLVSESGPLAKLNAHIEGVEPTWPDDEAVPYALRRLVERCLSRSPDARPPNTHVLEAELARVGRELERRARPSLPTPRVTVCEVTTVVRAPLVAANDEPAPARLSGRPRWLDRRWPPAGGARP
ncbi:MAG: serine/threonine protein kinase [Myxococcales bacterium]|nr:serine/threonine protein kinase [Myxococcales bacterium]